jgi:hypothetical protein
MKRACSAFFPVLVFLGPVTGVIRGRARLKGSWNFTLTAQDAQNVGSTISRASTINTGLYGPG